MMVLARGITITLRHLPQNYCVTILVRRNGRRLVGSTVFSFMIWLSLEVKTTQLPMC
jgi:hypothetical protein